MSERESFIAKCRARQMRWRDEMMAGAYDALAHGDVKLSDAMCEAALSALFMDPEVFKHCKPGQGENK